MLKMTANKEQIRKTKERLTSKIDMTSLSQIPLPRKPLSEETKASMQRRYATAFTENPRIKLQLFEEKVAARGKGRRRRVIVGNPLQMKDQINELFMKNKKFPVLEKDETSKNDVLDEENGNNKESSKLEGKKLSVEFLEKRQSAGNNDKELDTDNNNQIQEKASKLDIRRVLPKWFKGPAKEDGRQVSDVKKNEDKKPQVKNEKEFVMNDEKEYLLAHNMDGDQKLTKRQKQRRPLVSPDSSDDQSSSNDSPAINCDETLFDKFMRSVSRTSQACATGGYEPLNRSGGTHYPIGNMLPKYSRQLPRQRSNSDELEALMGAEYSPPEDAVLSKSDGYVRNKNSIKERKGALPLLDLYGSNSSSDDSSEIVFKRPKSRLGKPVGSPSSPGANSRYNPRGWRTPPIGLQSSSRNGSDERLFSSHDEGSFLARRFSPENLRNPGRSSVSPNRGFQQDFQSLSASGPQWPARLRPISTTGAAGLPQVRPQDLFALEKQMGDICTK